MQGIPVSKHTDAVDHMLNQALEVASEEEKQAYFHANAPLPQQIRITDLERARADAVWMTKDGDILNIRNMSDAHVLNCAFMLLRNGRWPYNRDMMAEFLFRQPAFEEASIIKPSNPGGDGCICGLNYGIQNHWDEKCPHWVQVL